MGRSQMETLLAVLGDCGRSPTYLMENPYQPTSLRSNATQLQRHVNRFVVVGLVCMTLTLLGVFLALYVLNQDLQFIPTATTFYLSTVGGAPVSNNDLIVALLLGTGLLALASVFLLSKAHRNRKHNSLITVSRLSQTP